MSLHAALLRAGAPWLASSAQQLGGGLAAAATSASQRLSGTIGSSLGWAGAVTGSQTATFSSASSATQAPAEAAAAVKTSEASSSGVAPAVAVDTLRRKLAQGERGGGWGWSAALSELSGV